MCLSDPSAAKLNSGMSGKNPAGSLNWNIRTTQKIWKGNRWRIKWGQIEGEQLKYCRGREKWQREPDKSIRGKWRHLRGGKQVANRTWETAGKGTKQEGWGKVWNVSKKKKTQGGKEKTNIITTLRKCESKHKERRIIYNKLKWKNNQIKTSTLLC